MKVLDTATPITNKVNCIRSIGYECIIRYYTRYTRNSKILKQKEAIAIGSQGIFIAVVYQDYNNSSQRFDYHKGYSAGLFAYTYAHEEIGQPYNSAIYFAVDYDASQTEVEQRIRPYFKGVSDAFEEEANGESRYKIGVYGSGLVCRLLLESNHATYAWLAGATGWRETSQFDQTKRWHLKQKIDHPAKVVCGVTIDDNFVNSNEPDFGYFKIFDSPSLGKQFQVIARSGLRLRSGPGLDFDVIDVMAFQSQVFLGRRQNDWVEIDLEGDGFVDGWAFASYLIKN